MLNAIRFFGPFSVIEAFQRAYQIAGDTANPVEWFWFKLIVQFYKITIYLNINAQRLSAILLRCA